MPEGSQLVRDPVCGMQVDKRKAGATRSHEGMTYYFCSANCAKQFDQDPSRVAHPGEMGHHNSH